MTQPANRRLVTEDRFLVTEAEAAAAYDAVTSIASLSPNYIINGAFDIWQRGTSFTNPASSNNTYTADRWYLDYANANPTSNSITRQTLVGEISDLNAQYFLRSTITTVGSTTIYRPVSQKIEDVRSLSGKTVTLSFYAKADSIRSVTPIYAQNFGIGGSSEVASALNSITLSNSWNRYTITFTLPSVSGKTIGANSFLAIYLQQAAASGSVLDITGVQLEAGSVATAFRRNANSLQGELAACQRYYYRTAVPGSGDDLCNGWVINSTTARVGVQFPVRMRTAPTALEQSNTASDYYVRTPASIIVCSAVPTWFGSTADFGSINLTVASGLTIGYGTTARAQNANAFFGWSAEL